MGKDYHMLQVKPFNNLFKGKDYYKAFINNKDMLIGINDQEWHTYVITQENFVILYKEQDFNEYLIFFEKKYLNK